MPYLDLENIYCWQRSTGFISKRYNLIGYLLSIYSVMDNGKVSFLTVCTDGEFEPCLGGVGWGIWTWTVKSSSRIHVLYLLIWRCSKLKSSLYKQMAQKKRVTRKSWSLTLPCTKNWPSNPAVGLGIWMQFWSMGAGIEMNQSSKV